MKHHLYIVWKDVNKLGIPVIDEQHRGIVSTINTFYYFILEKRGAQAIDPTVTLLNQYTKLHFETEEAILMDVGYPDLEEHVQLHQGLMSETIVVGRKAKAMRDELLLLKFLRDWWLNHINEEDMKYRSYVSSWDGSVNADTP